MFLICFTSINNLNIDTVEIVNKGNKKMYILNRTYCIRSYKYETKQTNKPKNYLYRKANIFFLIRITFYIKSTVVILFG